MGWHTVCLLLLLVQLGNGPGEEIRHFPSLIFGQILVGPGASKYDVIFEISAKRPGAVTIDLFKDSGEPLVASFGEPGGVVATTDSTFRVQLPPNETVRVRLLLPPDSMQQDVAIYTGWANFRSSMDFEVRAQVRVTKPDGSVLDHQLMLAQKPPAG